MKFEWKLFALVVFFFGELDFFSTADDYFASMLILKSGTSGCN